MLQQRSQQRANDDELVSLLVNRFAGRTLTSDDEVFEQRVRAATPAQVNAAVKKYIDPSQMVMVKAGISRRIRR